MRRPLLGAIALSFLVATDATARARVKKNVIYGMYSGLALLMDVYYPAKPNRIGIVFVAGSGFYAPFEFNASPFKITSPYISKATFYLGYMVINRGTSVPVSTCQTEQNWTRLPLGALISPTISYTTPYAFLCVRVTSSERC
jgi:hypothetical protein